MRSGIIFDIKEFALNDGPGIRTTVFLKGCPLRCKWCHNPEGLLFMPQKNITTGKVVGTSYTSDGLVSLLKKSKDLFQLSDGGITFSGGEPTAQPDFLFEVASSLDGIHKNLDTSGYCDSKIFDKLIQVFDLVYFDLKLFDEADHINMCGVSNQIIHENLTLLSNSSTRFHIRIPLIPDITDTIYNIKKIYTFIKKLPRQPFRIDLLSYNILAGGKYSSYGYKYEICNNKNKLNQIKQFINSCNDETINLL